MAFQVAQNENLTWYFQVKLVMGNRIDIQEAQTPISFQALQLELKKNPHSHRQIIYKIYSDHCF